MDITRTIQATENRSWVNQLFSGPPRQDWFPLPFTPRKAGVGDWLYVIYQGEIVGRCKIAAIPPYQGPDPVGGQGHTIDARCRVYVEVPGERSPSTKKTLSARGDMGIRYTPPLW